ncbi:DUF1127 domain-containing protein [Roseinatronobacter sp. S2]|uniref:DUF1127 domain-containing protein n=1 Tax=Roseinatronobacter sp. S2 TaxID=3035471 RepID=UPI00241093A1|nr:DUF1127 domain-containing protein [Roseinatronobacter sp. S2]WFE73667.1 DUF1127 domain-containing protein [Roseinatronobacter sp. S2]
MSFYAQSRPHADRVFSGFQTLTFGAFFAGLRSWNDARVTRRELNALTDRELQDIGLTRADIDHVALMGR